VYIADYVVPGYGHGAVMGVPGHDDRDLLFAEAHGLPIRKVVEEGRMVHSSASLDGLNHEVAAARIVHQAQLGGFGTRSHQLKLRDWLVSRQRYWGAPVPIIHCSNPTCQPTHAVPLDDLPVRLPSLQTTTTAVAASGDLGGGGGGGGGGLKSLLLGGGSGGATEDAMGGRPPSPLARASTDRSVGERSVGGGGGGGGAGSWMHDVTCPKCGSPGYGRCLMTTSPNPNPTPPSLNPIPSHHCAADRCIC
jgi:hypothetical protein